MTTWPEDELRKIAVADDLYISPFREDGVTYGTPPWIWSVAAGDALYVRGCNGQSSRWYQAAVRHKAGRIIAVGITPQIPVPEAPLPGAPRSSQRRIDSSRANGARSHAARLTH
jgi:hypothetical protein